VYPGQQFEEKHVFEGLEINMFFFHLLQIFRVNLSAKVNTCGQKYPVGFSEVHSTCQTHVFKRYNFFGEIKFNFLNFEGIELKFFGNFPGKFLVGLSQLLSKCAAEKLKGSHCNEIKNFSTISICERGCSVFWQQFSTGLSKLLSTCPKD